MQRARLNICAADRFIAVRIVIRKNGYIINVSIFYFCLTLFLQLLYNSSVEFSFF